jgi:hypothetical protein
VPALGCRIWFSVLAATITTSERNDSLKGAIWPLGLDHPLGTTKLRKSATSDRMAGDVGRTPLLEAAHSNENREQRGLGNREGTSTFVSTVIRRHRRIERAEAFNESALFGRPANFRRYLETIDEWFDYVTEYRDALGHRIPLHIPPGAVRQSNAAAATELQKQMDAVLNALDGLCFWSIPCWSRFRLWFCAAAPRRAFTKRLVRSLFRAFELAPEPPNTTSI